MLYTPLIAATISASILLHTSNNMYSSLNNLALQLFILGASSSTPDSLQNYKAVWSMIAYGQLIAVTNSSWLSENSGESSFAYEVKKTTTTTTALMLC